MKFIVLFGNLTTGVQTAHGPFNSSADARKWASAEAEGQWFGVYIIQEPRPAAAEPNYCEPEH